jgi:hypothetical protein
MPPLKRSNQGNGILSVQRENAYHHHMPDRKSEKYQTASAQIDRFKELARELGCDEDEGAFEGALKKLAQSKPLPKYEPKKRAPKA